MLAQLQIDGLSDELLAPKDVRSRYLVVEAAKLLYKLSAISLARKEVQARVDNRVDQDSFFWRQVGVELDGYYAKRSLELQQVLTEARRYDWSLRNNIGEQQEEGNGRKA